MGLEDSLPFIGVVLCLVGGVLLAYGVNTYITPSGSDDIASISTGLVILIVGLIILKFTHEYS